MCVRGSERATHAGRRELVVHVVAVAHVVAGAGASLYVSSQLEFDLPRGLHEGGGAPARPGPPPRCPRV